MTYDSLNGRTDPEMFGFPGGFSFMDGSIQYVGYGNASTCSNMNLGVGYITTTAGSAGCYTPCHSTRKEVLTSPIVKYLAW